MSRVVGIDLGTTNSLVACVTDAGPVVIRDKSGDALVPSVVSAAADGTMYVGREAERRLLTDAQRTVYSVKRFMGKSREDVQAEARHFPFRITGAPGASAGGGVVRIGLGDRELTPPEISALVLRELKHRAEAYFAAEGDIDPEVDRAVITVPAYFNDAQRTATRDAGRIAGLEVLRIINEPTAASLAYGLDKRHTGLIAVYDLGGGTFDISILRVEDGVFQVLSTNGDTHLGGDDIDVLLMDRVLADLGGTPAPEQVQGVRKAVIQAKWDLSEREETDVTVVAPAVVAQDSRPAVGAQAFSPAVVAQGSRPAYTKRITRADFESLIQPIVDRTLGPCRQALADAGLEPSQIDEVVLVGGSTRIPLVRRAVANLFGRTPHSEVNPDEVVALGAAVQADILVTGNRDMLLLDVTPLSLGIETMGGVMSKIILRNSTIPATGSEMFTSGVDNQTAVDIHVLQGERELVSDNRSLARFKLGGIPPMPAGTPRVQVQFQIDANGILSVTARELRTDLEQTIDVKPSYGLTDQEVERMLLESFEHAEADFAARLLIEARNEAENVIHATEKTLRSEDFAEIEARELQPGERTRIESVLGGLKMVLNSTDRETIQKWTQALNDATQHLAEVAMNRSVKAALSGKNVNAL
ncbi:MAG: molecular chaperone DnaK [Acidobacteria bacterium RIFCSPLOWO2_12_FULL_66_10]|nr:MAG: molecular chaperone DnaK [Acidobacteria bacterium RIFCSPLOWO2_12_FULL_66_10]